MINRLRASLLVPAAFGIALVLTGCSHNANVTQATQQQQASQQAAAYQNNPNMPPQARAAAMGMMQGENQMTNMRGKSVPAQTKK